MGLPVPDQKIEIVQTAQVGRFCGLRVVLGRVGENNGAHDDRQDDDGGG
jgi:hypothetical protein